MRLKDKHVEAWAAKSLAGQQVRGWVFLSTVTAVNPFAPDPNVATSGVEDYLAERGLDPSMRLHLSTGFAALTESRFAVASTSAARNRPKELLAEAAGGQIGCRWFDNSNSGNGFRNWLFELPDGRHLAAATGIKVLGRTTEMRERADRFVELLADRADLVGQGLD